MHDFSEESTFVPIRDSGMALPDAGPREINDRLGQAGHDRRLLVRRHATPRLDLAFFDLR